jgi:hypothetical protein
MERSKNRLNAIKSGSGQLPTGRDWDEFVSQWVRLRSDLEPTMMITVEKHHEVSSVPQPGATPSHSVGKHYLPRLPHAAPKLVLIPWTLVAIFVARWIEDCLGASGINSGLRFLANIASIVILVLLGGEFFGRLQIKPPPPSIR